MSVVAITGASGFLGRRLREVLIQDGHELRLLGRSRPQTLGAQERFFTCSLTDAEPPAESLEGASAVIHLAGEPVAQRWNAAVKERIRNSRVDGTRHLVRALSTLPRRPELLVSASAIGYYGDTGEREVDESAPAGRDFLARVCVEWEREAVLAEALGVRVVRLRIGVVLGPDGGALAKMLPPFKLGAGGPLGSGRQWMSWVHRDDVVGLIRHAMATPSVQGPVNATAPEPVRNTEFTRELGKAVHRPAVLPVPGLALKLLFGEMAGSMLASQRVVPRATRYAFAHPTLAEALRSIV